MEPEVSIIVPAVKKPEVLKKCLDHIRRNTPPIYELIVVADGSNEEMLQYLMQLHREGVRLILNPKLQGFAAAINQGIKISRGKYISIVTMDVYVHPLWLQPLKRALERFGFKWASAQILQPDKAFRPFNISCCLIDREALEKVGLLDEEFCKGKGYEDDDLVWRFIKAGFKVIGVPSSRADHPESEVTFRSLHSEQRIKELGEINARYFYQKWGFVGTQWHSFPCLNIIYDRYDWLRDKAEALGGSILDVGSANNVTFKGFSNVVCIDLDLYRFEGFVRADGHHLPFKKNSFNLACLGDTLEHVEDPVMVLKEAKRVAEKIIMTIPDDSPDEGERFMSEVYFRGGEKLHQEAVEKWIRDNQPVKILDDNKHRHLFHVRFYNEISLKEDLKKAGLKYNIERIEYEHYKGWGIVCE